MEDVWKIENIQVEKRDELIVKLGLAMLDIVDVNEFFMSLNRAGKELERAQERGFGRPGPSSADFGLAGPESSQRGQGVIVGDRRQFGQRVLVSLQRHVHLGAKVMIDRGRRP
jgi:hypothetical protein